MLQEVNFKGVNVLKKPECRMAREDRMPIETPHDHRLQRIMAMKVEVRPKRMTHNHVHINLGFHLELNYDFCTFSCGLR